MNNRSTEAHHVSQFLPSATPIACEAASYLLDAIERGVLLLNVMRERSKRYCEHAAKTVPHVLKFECEFVMDGRILPRPVNYGLVRIAPPDGVKISQGKRPFVIVDPRAGHGPGIGGFKAQSEIGVVFQAGHPCYFIGFLPEPIPGQTIEDVTQAFIAFVEKVGTLHPLADGKPAVVGNCQAGWAIMMAAAKSPELFGPLIVAGSPLSYWAGVRGRDPMRYTGGLLGGSWLTALTSDLGKGKFDGAWLVSNFENLNPANTLWTKHYNLYARVDTEAPRYLEFELWWGGHVLLNAEEIQFIVDELFIGNKLATAEVVGADGINIDLRDIRSPIVVFCSKADNITPPPQALGWILDLYESVEDIRAHGQTIVYAVHESAGHLGIFVSGSVAKKEYREFTSNIDMIDVLPPGLYEAVMTPRVSGQPGADLVTGDYLVKFEARTLDDVQGLVKRDDEEERRFAAVAHLSKVNLGLYQTFVQPWVRLCVTHPLADWIRRIHPLRLQYDVFSPANPFLSGVPFLAKIISERRHAVLEDNPFWQAQEWISQNVQNSLDAYRDSRDQLLELLFHGIYGSPLLQAFAGMKLAGAPVRRRPGEDAMHRAFVARRMNELRGRIPVGGPREAAIRALLYVRMADGIADERGFRLVEQMREDAGSGLTLSAFKKIVREQFFILNVDERAAVGAIPAMLMTDPDLALRISPSLRRLFKVVGAESATAKARLAEIEALFDASRDFAAKLALRTPELPDPSVLPASPSMVTTSRKDRHS